MFDKKPEDMGRRTGQGTQAGRVRSRLLTLAMLGLRCLAALFIVLAVFSFGRGLRQHFAFLGGVLFYGPASVGFDSFPEATRTHSTYAADWTALVRRRWRTLPGGRPANPRKPQSENPG